MENSIEPKNNLGGRPASIRPDLVEKLKFDSLDFFRKKLGNILAEFSQTAIASITGYGFILDALSVAGL